MKIDFTNCPVNPLKMYGGMNGNKIELSITMKTIC